MCNRGQLGVGVPNSPEPTLAWSAADRSTSSALTTGARMLAAQLNRFVSLIYMRSEAPEETGWRL